MLHAWFSDKQAQRVEEENRRQEDGQELARRHDRREHEGAEVLDCVADEELSHCGGEGKCDHAPQS